MPQHDFYQFLKISNSPILAKFLHECVDDLIGEKQLNFNNYNSDIEWTVEDYNTAKESIQSFYKECARNNNFELNTSDLSDTIQDAIKNCYEIRKDNILQTLVEEHILDNGHNLLQNFDWKLKWVLGSSKLASIRESLLQVDLYCVQNEEEVNKKQNIINFEMNVTMLDDVISKLEEAKYNLQLNV